MSEIEVLSPLSAEALEMFKSRGVKKIKSRAVCVCGHSVSHHENVVGSGKDNSVCTPGRLLCECTEIREILVTDNLRMFMFATTGVGAEHALGKGILSCLRSGNTFEWVASPLMCDMCNEEAVEPLPVSANHVTQKPVDYGSTMNKIVCKNCYLTKWLSF
jgi:hypothetical protein